MRKARIAFQVSPRMKADLTQFAKQHTDMSISDLMRVLIRQYLDAGRRDARRARRA